MIYRKLTSAVFSLLLIAPVTANAIAAAANSSTIAAPSTSGNVVIDAMTAELERSMKNLKEPGKPPLYFLAYRVFDDDSLHIEASYGAISYDSAQNRRILQIEARVGNMQTDNTHKVRGIDSGFDDSGSSYKMYDFSLENDPAAIRTALWFMTDENVKHARREYVQVKTNRDVKVAEEDQSDDFSLAKPVVSITNTVKPSVDAGAWRDKVRALSAIYKEYPLITEAKVGLETQFDTRYIANSEGTKIVTADTQARLYASAATVAEDGMTLHLFDSVEATAPDKLPDERTMAKRVRALADSLMSLRAAKPAQPYVGPAILRGKAAGVFFHEVLGHRVEGHRQKDEYEGRTFAKKVGERIMPTFISVKDDPTMSRLGNVELVGHYKFDNEGVAAQKVTIVDKGILRNFLMGRSPINNFNHSNGHSRGAPGQVPVARQGNIVVESSKVVPYETLRTMLVNECKRQKKPYGLIFDEIAGGFAVTQSFMPQSYELLPLRVTRVWANGKPDEMLRGVNLVGTPLASLETIMCAGNDTQTFNGSCGAESGWVPVSASSPSLLVRTIETAREYKEQDKPPILPAPPLMKSSFKAEVPQR
jgi:predicted Zn-dependent protease